MAVAAVAVCQARLRKDSGVLVAVEMVTQLLVELASKMELQTQAAVAVAIPDQILLVLAVLVLCVFVTQILSTPQLLQQVRQQLQTQADTEFISGLEVGA
jgi:hypothetical protein